MGLSKRHRDLLENVLVISEAVKGLLEGESEINRLSAIIHALVVANGGKVVIPWDSVNAIDWDNFNPYTITEGDEGLEIT